MGGIALKNGGGGLLEGIFRAILGIVMTLVLFITMYPFVYMLMLSLSSGIVYGKMLLWPQGFSLVAYHLMITKVKFLDSAVVSIIRATLGPACTILVIFMGAFSLSQNRLIARKLFSRYVVFSMYFSAGLLPVYLNISSLKLTGTFWIYIIPYLVSAYELILIRTFIQDMPRSLEESATIDGANDIQTAFRVVFPLCLPVLAAVTLFEFVNQWNSYTDTLLYNAQVPGLFTLQYSLSNYLSKQMNFSPTDFVNKQAQQNFNLDSLRMAMTVVVCLPIAVVYPFLQRYFIKGILVGSIKG